MASSEKMNDVMRGILGKVLTGMAAAAKDLDLDPPEPEGEMWYKAEAELYRGADGLELDSILYWHRLNGWMANEGLASKMDLDEALRLIELLEDESYPLPSISGCIGLEMAAVRVRLVDADGEHRDEEVCR